METFLDKIVSIAYIGNVKNKNSFLGFQMIEKINNYHNEPCVQDENCKRILERGSDKMFKDGFSRINMDELASELQMSKKTIYKYFESKKCLVEAVADNFTGNAAREIGKVIDSDKNAVLKIIGLLEFFSKIANVMTDVLVFDLQKKLPWLWKKIDEFRIKMMNRNLSIIINQGKEEGLIKDYSTEITVTMIIAAVRAVVNPEFLMNNNCSLETAFKTGFDIVFSGLLTEEGLKIYNNYKKEQE